DSARLRQIIMSLLNNANANTEEGEILLVVAAEEQADGSQTLRLVVQDTGHPMGAEARSSLLEAAAPTGLLVDMMERQGQLSLYRSQQLVRLLGGQTGIKESTEPGNSSCITLQPELIGPPDGSSRQSQCLNDQNIRIVDDNATCRKVLQQ